MPTSFCLFLSSFGCATCAVTAFVAGLKGDTGICVFFGAYTVGLLAACVHQMIEIETDLELNEDDESEWFGGM